MLYSNAGGSLTPWAEPQMKRFALGVALMLFIGMVPIYFWRNVAGVGYILSFVLLLIVEFFGDVGMGAQRWIDLGFMRLQPSELMKVTLVMFLAAYYDWLDIKKVSRPFYVAIPVILIMIPTVLVLKQPDLGTSILLVMGGAIVMFAAGVSWWYFGAVAAMVSGLVAAVFTSRGTTWQLLKDYQYRRIDTFLDPSSDPLGAGYHISQAKIALGSGGWTGRGFMQGTQSRLNFFARKAHRFHFHDTGRRVRISGRDLPARPLRVNHHVLHRLCDAQRRPLWLACHHRDRRDVLFVLCGQYVDGHGIGPCCGCPLAACILRRVRNARVDGGVWHRTIGTCSPPTRSLMTLTLLFSAPDRLWPAYREALPVALAAAGIDARITRAADEAPEAVDYIIYAPNEALTDFTPFTRTKAVLSLWAGVERIVSNPTLTQPLCRMVDDGLALGMRDYVVGHVMRHHLGMDAHIHGAGAAVGIRWCRHWPAIARWRFWALGPWDSFARQRLRHWGSKRSDGRARPRRSQGSPVPTGRTDCTMCYAAPRSL